MEVRYLRIKVLHICKTYFEIRKKRSTRFFSENLVDLFGYQNESCQELTQSKNKLPHVNAAASASLFISE